MLPKTLLAGLAAATIIAGSALIRLAPRPQEGTAAPRATGLSLGRGIGPNMLEADR